MLVLDRPTGHVVKAFAECVAKWQKLPLDDRSISLEVEELIAIGNKTFEAIVDFDARWHAALFDSHEVCDDSVLIQIEGLYQAWGDPASRLLTLARSLQSYHFEGLETLVEHIDLATSPLDENAMGSMSDELIALRDAAVAEHRTGKSGE